MEVESCFEGKLVFVRIKKRLKEALFILYKNNFVIKNLQRKAGLGSS